MIWAAAFMFVGRNLEIPAETCVCFLCGNFWVSGNGDLWVSGGCGRDLFMLPLAYTGSPCREFCAFGFCLFMFEFLAAMLRVLHGIMVRHGTCVRCAL